MLTVASPVEHLRRSSTKRLAVLFRITRTDSVQKFFTMSDTNIDWDGDTYIAAGASQPSARRWQNALKPSTFDIRGALDDSQITPDDLHAGRYDEAMVEEIIVDWRYPWAGSLSRHFFWIDKIQRTGEYWLAEMSGPARFLRRKAGSTLTRNCERTLGDLLCTVALAPLTVTGVGALGTEDGARKLVILADPSDLTAGSDGDYDYGFVTFTSGSNNGLSENIKTYRASDRRIELQGPMPFAINPTDEFSITLGCDKLFTTCVNRYSNGVNYAGFLYVPGTDRVLRAPARR